MNGKQCRFKAARSMQSGRVLINIFQIMTMVCFEIHTYIQTDRPCDRPTNGGRERKNWSKLGFICNTFLGTQLSFACFCEHCRFRTMQIKIDLQRKCTVIFLKYARDISETQVIKIFHDFSTK